MYTPLGAAWQLQCRILNLTVPTAAFVGCNQATVIDNWHRRPIKNPFKNPAEQMTVLELASNNKNNIVVHVETYGPF